MRINLHAFIHCHKHCWQHHQTSNKSHRCIHQGHAHRHFRQVLFLTQIRAVNQHRTTPNG
ncbi:Uncharacterised protein [Vibrio cholerae]|nr:Uncharacterised protein [Vibrio cholerae]CSI54688.1 Uncharacterised protein [Vibrio cholerae]